jgi:hypothetical protein
MLAIFNKDTVALATAQRCNLPYNLLPCLPQPKKLTLEISRENNYLCYIKYCCHEKIGVLPGYNLAAYRISDY